MRVRLICRLILQAIKQKNAGSHLLSIDEKTGVQALERIAKGQPVKVGQLRRIEHEYKRHGTTCLMAAQDIGSGKLFHHHLHPTRTEEDFLDFIKATVDKFPQQDEVVFLTDQLNTHMSASLVKWIAEHLGFKKELGKKGYKGILKNKQSRKIFLQDPGHRIRFIYTPKHCSWLNPIENWFSKLQRHVITYGSFTSVEDLKEKIEQYIQFYNACLVKPMNWKFKGYDDNDSKK